MGVDSEIQKFEGYEQPIPVNDDEDNSDPTENEIAQKMSSFTAHKQFFKEPLSTGDGDDMAGFNKPGKIIDREDDYRRKRLNRIISPKRNDPFLDKTPGPEVRTYSDIMRWDATPSVSRENRWDETPNPTPKRQRYNTPGVTPFGAIDMATPTTNALMRGTLIPEQYNLLRWEKDIEDRNRPLTDEELDAMFPHDGYKVLDPPSSYVVPIRPITDEELLAMPRSEENRGQQFDVLKEMPGGLPLMKPEDYLYFGSLLYEDNEEELTPKEQKRREIMKLLLKVKNGTPTQRKTAARQLIDEARELGAGPLFKCILPLLMQPTLADQERYLLVKVIDRVLYKLGDLVRPYVVMIFVVIEPLLIDEDYYARVDGREIISSLSKAAGLATMIDAMRPGIDIIDEDVRDATARAFSVVASVLGIPALLPFLKAVCQSKKSWQARHTGIKSVQQIAILIGCAVLPHMKSLVEIIEHGLNDDNQEVRTITALSLAALAEASAPHGIES